jgi:hypothetical protein
VEEDVAITVYGPGSCTSEKILHFGEEKPSEGDMSYRLTQGLAS